MTEEIFWDFLPLPHVSVLITQLIRSFGLPPSPSQCGRHLWMSLEVPPVPLGSPPASLGRRKRRRRESWIESFNLDLLKQYRVTQKGLVEIGMTCSIILLGH